jgi:hypothetical protein
VKRTAFLVLVLLAWLAAGPWAVLLVLLSLALPFVRRGLGPTLGSALGLLLVAILVTTLVVLVPDGRLPLPPGPGLLVSPRYTGAPASPGPVPTSVPAHPFLAPHGTNSMHADAWASDSYPYPGPLGRSPEVRTAWYGLEECATLNFDSAGDLVGLCGSLDGPTLHLIDSDSLRKRDSFALPERTGERDVRPWEDLCGGAYFYLDHRQRAVVATTDRHILVVATRAPDGRPGLSQETSHDLRERVPAQDCLLALMPDWQGRIWFATEQGRVGTVEPDTGATSVVDLGEEIANSIAVDEDGGVYVVTTHALYRLDVGAGRATVTWRAAYDRGRTRKPGQLSRGSGTTPTVLPGGLVAITDNAEPRMHVVVNRTEDGSRVCRVPVFDHGASATENSLVSVGDGVVVENNHGYDSPLSTSWGRSTAPGLARVDVTEEGCAVAWTSPEVAPSSVAKVSLANGLLYAYTTRPGWWAVTSWYLTAIDVRTGRTVFSVRTGQGLLSNNHYAAVSLAPDGSVFIATLGGVVRVRDG